MHLKGSDAAKCAIRLYNAGLFYFGYRPHDLTPFDTNVVFVMSQLGVGKELQPPVDRSAFAQVIEATAKEFGVLVREANGGFFNQGTPIGNEIPLKPSAGGINKFISGTRAGEFATTLLNAGLIVTKDQINDACVRVTSQPQLTTQNSDQSRDFDLVIKATAGAFGDVTVSDLSPESI